MKKTPEDIYELGKKIAKFSSNRHINKKSSYSDNYRFLARAFALGAEFVGAVIVGVGLGVVLDMFFESKVVFTIIFSLLGCVAGVLNMYRSMNKMEKDLD